MGWMLGWEIPLRPDCEVCRSLIARGATESNDIIKSQRDRTGIETGFRALVRRLLSAIIHAGDEGWWRGGSTGPNSQSL